MTVAGLHGGRALIIILACVVAAGCSGPSPLASLSAGPPVESVRPTVTSPASAPETPSPTPTTACLDEALPDTPGLVGGTFAEVVTTHLVRRSAPRIADDSAILGELNSPTRVFVVAGPVPSDGYDWWAVIPEGGNRDAAVWVAAAGKDGEEWLRPLPRKEGTWEVLTRYDVLGGVPVASRAAAGADGRLYFFGGSDGAAREPNPSRQALAFDPIGCEWEVLSALPIATDGLHAVQAADGRFHAIGPESSLSGTSSSSLHLIFDPRTGAWERGEPVPAVVNYGSAIAADRVGGIWTFGNGIQRYDAAADHWTDIAVPPPWADSIDSAVLEPDGRFTLLYGGEGGIWRYDPGAGSLAHVEQPRVARYNARMVALSDGTLVIGGGYLAGSCVQPEDAVQTPRELSYSLLDAYSPATGTWQAVAPLRMDLDDAAPIVVNGSLYVAGLREVWNRSGSDPFIEEVALIIARFVPAAGARSSAREPFERGAGGCGG